MSVLEEFFRDVDAQWRWPVEGKLRLSLIGSAALMFQTSYERGTKDGDVLETANLTSEIKEHLLGIAGKDSRLFERHRLYLEIVPSGLPFLPHVPVWHPVSALNAGLQRLEVQALDVIDVVVSKLKRAHAADMSDVAAMIERGRVPHARLLERFRSAVEIFSESAWAADLPKYVAALHRAERDYFDVPETEIELPGWV